MKRRYLLLIGVGLALLLVGLGFGLAALLPADRSDIAYVTSFSATVLVLLPVLAGVLMARPTFDPNGRGGREALRAYVRVFWVGEVVAAAVCLGIAVTAPEIALALVVVVALSMGFLAAALRIGRRFPAPSAAVAPLPTVPDWSRSVIRRKVGTIVLTAVLGTGIGIAGLVALDHEIPAVEAVLLGPAIGLLAAAVWAMVVTWPLARSSRLALGRSYADQTTIPRVVLGGKPAELSEEGVRRAALYARIATLLFPFQLGQLVLLFSGLWPLALLNLSNGTAESVTAVAGVVVFPLFLVIGVPLLIVQTRRAKRYAAAHADLLPADADAGGTDPTVRPG
ncbi:hypothetical protein [Planctomonas deserti]|uniref:hypothetical protein n=1 Tax=Planctomonas deserti TaxID=2144185 RepID=UPI000D3D832D|nr:hypothetical protein [Planctomonas deserti]